MFVGGVSSTVKDEELGEAFSQFGRTTYARVVPGKGCGFVHYSTRQEAEAAIAGGAAVVLGGRQVRVSWGRGRGAPSKVRGGVEGAGGEKGMGGGCGRRER